MTTYHRALYTYTVVYSSMYLLITIILVQLQQAVGVSIVHRNRKHFFLSQSTLREEFAEEKYQVFDKRGLLVILVQVNLSSPVERV